MKKLILFLCLLMAIPATATKKTFKAACLNVDGLPPTVNITGITKINMNPEGPQETGTAKMSEPGRQQRVGFLRCLRGVQLQ